MRRARTGASSIVKGTPGHGSQPLRTDNALVTAAEVVRRLNEYQPETMIHDIWRRFVEGMFPGEMAELLLDPASLRDLVQTLPLGAGAAGARVHAHDVRADRHARRSQDQRDPRPRRTRSRHPHAAGPDRPGDPRDARRDPRRARAIASTIEVITDELSTASPIDTPLWESLNRVSNALGARRRRVRPVPHRRRDRRAVLPPHGHPVVRLRAVLQSPDVRGLRARCSTATTSASTSSHCACRPSCGGP